MMEEARFVGGRADPDSRRTWSKWQSTSLLRLGEGSAQLTLSRLGYEGDRHHSDADLRNLNARVQLPVAGGGGGGGGHHHRGPVPDHPHGRRPRRPPPPRPDVDASHDVRAAPRAPLGQADDGTEAGPVLQSVVGLAAGPSVTRGLRYDRGSFGVNDRLIPGTNPDDSGRRLMPALSGSLGFTVNPADALTGYASVGTSFETPTTTELANRPDTAGGFNPTLKPQQAV